MPDLLDIPGMSDLRARTRGDSRIVIALLDGPADLSRACFAGADIARVAPYWTGERTVDPRYQEAFLAIENSGAPDKERAEKITAAIPDEEAIGSLHLAFHATHVASTLAGQPLSPVEGIAPRCRVINIPLGFDNDTFLAPLSLTRALDLALDMGANIIHVAVCRPTQTGVADDLLERAVRRCQSENVLLVAPAGNDKGECWCVPAVLEHVLTVGAMKDSGEPFQFSNWGGAYQGQGVLAPGENILGAQPGTDLAIRKKGTSCAAPVVTGVAALLMSLQLQSGAAPDAEAVRTAIVNSAIPCDPAEIAEPARCLRGKLNIAGASRLLGNTTGLVPSSAGDRKVAAQAGPGPGRVYVLGTLGYDFGSEARRDSFRQLMPGARVDGARVPANPYDARQMVDYLSANPSEASSLIWTLNVDQTPLYAIQPAGPFGADVYDAMRSLLAGQTQPSTSADFVDRVSIAGSLTDRSARLLSGQLVPAVRTASPRGMYGWTINSLVAGAVATVLDREPSASELDIRRTLTNFLQRVYYDLRNNGQSARDRALNFAATNLFQAASSMASAVAARMELDSIDLEKSPFCRINSDCWEVKLKFFDPENGLRARKVYRFTIDVSDTLPVTVGVVRSWSVPR